MFVKARKNLARPVIVVALLVSVIHTGWLQARAEDARAPIAASFSAEALYRGLVLGHGEVADLIPEIRDHLRVSNAVRNPVLLRAVAAFHDRIVAAVRAADPAFLESFAAVMRSGDRLAIEAKLEEAARLTARLVSQMAEVEAVRRMQRDDPARFNDLLARLRQDPGTRDLDDATLREAADVAIRYGFDPGHDDGLASVSSSVVAILFVVAAVVAAVTVVALMSYGAVLNVAVGAVYYSSVVASADYFSSGGRLHRRSASSELGLLHEQMVDSIAQLLAA